MSTPSRWGLAARVGTRVRCADPDSYIGSLAAKLRNRVGVVARHQEFSGAPIIEFAAVGRRKALTWVPGSPHCIVAEEQQ